MMRHSIWAVGFAVIASVSTAQAKSKAIETAGTAVAIAMPLVAGGIAFAHDQDWTGVAQMGVVTLATVGTAYGLKNVIHEERPDLSDDQSLPSDTAALAFAPAAFLWDRYGWKYGLPAYAAAAFVGYSRVDAKKHHWYDVVASAGIAWGYSQLFTTEYHRRYEIHSDIYATPEGAFVHVSMNF
jgi:membrane-associated phospholipid phosphatase